MIINISNNPANPKFGNEGDTRHLEIAGCEFFENWDYRQIIVAWILRTKDWNWKTTWEDKCVVNSNNWNFDYDALKTAAIETCEFVATSNVVKAQACPWTTTTLVAAFDAQGLFN